MNYRNVLSGLIVAISLTPLITMAESNNNLTEDEVSIATANGVFNVFKNYCKDDYVADKQAFKHYRNAFAMAIQDINVMAFSSLIEDEHKKVIKENGVRQYCAYAHKSVDFLREIYFKK